MSKCWWHDWEMVERIGECQLKANVEAKINGTLAIEFVGESFFYIKKACMKCPEVVDTITPQIEAIKENMQYHKERQKIAKKALGDTQ